MCDYSLYVVENRLAQEGEQLLLYRFTTGSLGFASPQDLEQQKARAACKADAWTTIKKCLGFQQSPTIRAVCIPPGARLLLTDVPERVQNALKIGPAETVTFTEVSHRSHTFRDALVLLNGTQVLLQDLAEGVRVFVLSLDGGELTASQDMGHTMQLT